ncbi:MAG: hypothetical protein AUJ92_15150 [Armatimonadetes bacterium CG2_30_59_28]|nr:extracellular solute-binding protein [Armatimonadota bacterium]OIO92011.1 MAG: hypothetical protein AUJ92_15150 [Armatimonadetes bacterium CG2_30_59_28]
MKKTLCVLDHGTLLYCLVSCIAAYLFAGCGRSTVTPGEKLTIISPHYEGIREEYGDAFNSYRQSQGRGEVELEWIDQGGTSDDLRFVKSEFSRTPDGINIDIFWGGGVDPYQELKEQNLLEKHTLPEDELRSIGRDVGGVPVYDPDGLWYGSALSGFGIMFNSAVLRERQLPQPKTWTDLADGRFHNWITATDPRHSGSAHMMFEIVLQAYGWDDGFDLLGRMARNSRAFTESASQVPKDVAQGEAAAAPVIDFYAWSESQDVEGKVGFVYPEGRTVINPDGIAILKGAPHRSLAEEFVEFVLSEKGQKLLMLPAGKTEGPKQFTLRRMSVLPNLYDALAGKSLIEVNPFKWKSGFVYNSEKGSTRWEIVNDLVGALMIDPHAELRQTKVVGRLVVPPVSEGEAVVLAGEKWKDAAFRNRTMSQWTSNAKKRYQSLRG